MPYRRLPNTDQSRLRALRIAIEQTRGQDYGNQVVSFKTLHDAQSYLSMFETKLIQYQQTFDNQVSANKRYQQLIYNARLYVSHFIQVLNLAVIRGEIRKEHKLFYQLEPENHTVPDLSTEGALLEWGKKIIDGENERTRNGGFPLYNPAIAKVRVHYDMFQEYKATQRLHQSSTNRTWSDLNEFRERGDTIILDIWNQVEEKFKDCPPYTRLENCKRYGLVYYYRKGEKEITKEDDE
ncbi:MAG: hypothetical protein LBN23_03630 [Paludibacter sp.]|jgi:hypothetical protein|nr:hypothetical protein [Paludibacter sp.]